MSGCNSHWGLLVRRKVDTLCCAPTGPSGLFNVQSPQVLGATKRLLSTACLQSRESFRVSEKVGVSALPEILVDDMGTSLPHNRSVSAALKHCGKWWRDGTVNMVDQALNRGRALKREAMDVETYAITRHVRVVKLSPRSCLQTHKPNDAPLIRACTRSAAKCGSVPRQRRC